MPFDMEDSFANLCSLWCVPLANSIGNVGKNGLAVYDIKPWIKKMLELEMREQVGATPETREAIREVKKFMEQGLNKSNFRRLQTFLLYAEEYIENKEFEKIKFDKAVLRFSSGNVSIEIPGITESSLSITAGIELSFVTSGKRIIPGIRGSFVIPGKRYEDRVRKIDDDILHLEDNEDTLINELSQQMRGVICKDVRFYASKMIYKRAHRAIWNIDEFTIHRLLPKYFVSDISDDKLMTYDDIQYFNTEIQANKEQSQAVKHILNGTSYPYPYILFGPPGTGKTHTITEAILQVHEIIPYSRIVVAAPSNAAADILALKLKDFVPQTDIIRLMSSSRSPHDDLRSLVRYCTKIEATDPNYDMQISLDELSRFRIIVTTLGSSAILADASVNMFTHVFIDEASQATVSEILLPIVGVLKEDGHIILAGDPHQLGPVVKSEVASQYGMETSLLERLMDSCSLYRKNKKGVRNPQFITKLLKNFRSHPDLIKLPSKLFYDNELIPAAKLNDVSKLCKLPFIRKKGFPILFHGVKSPHSDSIKSSSLYNEEEMTQVFKYIKLLQRHSVPTYSIGVLSPYKLQVTKIKNNLKKMYIEDILVGSTEQFQGGERDVMIISTVRSSLVSTNPGFLNDKKRFNVAITRAKSLMIVIGDPYFLNHSNFRSTWNNLVQFVVKNDCYEGCRFWNI